MDKDKIALEALKTTSFLTSYGRQSWMFEYAHGVWELMMSNGKSIMEAFGIVPDADDSKWFWQIDAEFIKLRDKEQS
jgi:hypothetical protein